MATKDMLSVIEDCLGTKIQGRVMLLNGTNATGKTLAIGAVRGIVRYYSKMHNNSIKLIDINLSNLSSIGNHYSTTAERMRYGLDDLLSRKLKEGKSIVLIDDFFIYPEKDRMIILNLLKKGIGEEYIVTALVGLASDDVCLTIQSV